MPDTIAAKASTEIAETLESYFLSPRQKGKNTVCFLNISMIWIYYDLLLSLLLLLSSCSCSCSCVVLVVVVCRCLLLVFVVVFGVCCFRCVCWLVVVFKRGPY